MPDAAERQGRDQTATVGDPAGRHHWYRPDGIDNGGNEPERAPSRAPMAAGVLALRDDHIRSRVGRSYGFGDGLHLADEECSRRVDLLDVGRRVAERELDSGRSVIQGERETVRSGVQCEGDEPDPDARIARRGKLPGEPDRVAIAAPDEAEPPGVGDRGRQAPSGHASHGSQENRVPDAGQTRERRGDHEEPPVAVGMFSSSLR